MARQYRITQQPGGSVTVSESELDREGREVMPLWSCDAANIQGALLSIEEHEQSVR